MSKETVNMKWSILSAKVADSMPFSMGNGGVISEFNCVAAGGCRPKTEGITTIEKLLSFNNVVPIGAQRCDGYWLYTFRIGWQDSEQATSESKE